jgi:DNA replicative helicase MCM subunit Mcm2 (Cdc46/Mcm family)
LATSNDATYNDNNITVSIRPATLIQLHKMGFKQVPLSANNEVVIPWSPIYENSDIWTPERLAKPAEYSKFVNVATVFGKTNIKDEQGLELYLNCFDCDSEYVYKVLTTPVEQLSWIDLVLKSKIQNLIAKTGGENVKCLLDYLKLFTCVVKTKKSYGVHVYWLSHKQNNHIRTEDCRSGYEFEIKTDKGSGHATLPPSTHRADPMFRYKHLGRTDKIEINDKLYDIFLELFAKECLVSANGNGVNSTAIDTNKTEIMKLLESGELRKESSFSIGQPQQQQNSSVTLYDLSDEMIATSVAYLQPYYKKHNRDNLTMALSGTAWYARISKESTTKIISKICNNTEDEETNSRLTTVHNTYETALIDKKKITGGPTLAEIITRIKNCDLSTANQLVDRLKTFWHDDIKAQRKSAQQAAKDSDKILSVAEALRLMNGPANVSGKIVGISGVQAMICGIHFECSSCSYKGEPLIFNSKPVWKAPVKERNKCPTCSEGNGHTLLATFDYVPAVEIQLQDTKRVNDIEQLNALLFSQDTENIPLNEVVTLKGNVHVVRKNDNSSNKLTPFLYVESLDRENKEEEIRLTDSVTKQIKEFAISHEVTLIDDLVTMTAPRIIGNELAKRVALIVVVNAGLPNDKNRLPHRIRSNAGLIGDPSQAKTLFLHEIAELVPGSRVESAQSGTGISMTVYIEKDEGSQRIIRPGPVVLSSGSILGLNEFGQMRNIEDHKYFTDAAEEGEFTVTKHGFNVHIEAHPSIIFTANPISGFWKNPDRIDPAEFPILTQMGERIDFLIPFIEKTDETSIREYTKKRRELTKRLGSFATNTLWLKKYLLYARNLNPDLPDDVRIKLEDFLVEMAKQGIRGLPRKLDALERTAIGFAKLKLKDVVDEEDAYDTMALFNDILKFYKQDVETQNPRDITFNQCLKILQMHPYEWRLDDLIVKACQEDPSVESYIGDNKKAEFNSKIKAIKPLLDKHPCIQRVRLKPTIYRWTGNNCNDKYTINRNSDNTIDNATATITQTTDAHHSNKNYRDTSDKSKDVSDVSDTQITLQAENFYDYYITANADIEYSNPQNINNNIKSDHHPPLSEQVNEITEKLTSEIKKETSDTSNTSAKDDKKVIEEEQKNILKIRHSESAHIVTNDDILEEQEEQCKEQKQENEDDKSKT